MKRKKLNNFWLSLCWLFCNYFRNFSFFFDHFFFQVHLNTKRAKLTCKHSLAFRIAWNALFLDDILSVYVNIRCLPNIYMQIYVLVTNPTNIYIKIKIILQVAVPRTLTINIHKCNNANDLSFYLTGYINCIVILIFLYKE